MQMHDHSRIALSATAIVLGTIDSVVMTELTAVPVAITGAVGVPAQTG